MGGLLRGRAGGRRRTTIAGMLALAATVVGATLAAPPPGAVADETAPVVVEQTFTTSDGVDLATTLTSPGPVAARPTVVEFSPYGRTSQTLHVSDDYNYLLVQIRGTGSSDGSFDALGPRSQADVVEVLEWACAQPFSDGTLALNGFSASAIVLYNSWHQELPCVRAAILKSGTHELYRDLLVPGGIENIVPGAGVLALIGAPALLQGADRADDPASALPVIQGMFESGLNAGLLHPTLDAWWQQRGWRGDANDIPVLAINGFFDVESRGAFQAYQALRADGAHLLMAGGHDGVPAGSDGGAAEAQAWLDHYVRGVDNGVEDHPAVQLLLAGGDREDYLAGDWTSYDAADWPVPGTTWTDLHLSPQRSTAAKAPNDRTLALEDPATTATMRYLTVPSFPTMSDVPNGAIVGAGGLDALTGSLPFLTETNLAGLTGLGYTTAPLQDDVTLAGPAALELTLNTSMADSGIWVVLSDVAPDGTAHPLTVGRLSTSYPDVVESRSLVVDGDVVQPYGDYSTRRPAGPLAWRRYHVELWPVGNTFEAGHRIRVQLLGTSAASMPELTALHSVRLGGSSGARLLLPVLPGSDLDAALAP